MKVKFKMTTDGEVAIMPRAEYERLKDLAREAGEDIGTARLVARAKREIGGGAPVFPKAIVDRLGGGENPVRVLRQFRDLTQEELAAAAGITQHYLSDLENGKRKGPLALHRKLANALGVPLELLSTIAVSEQEADQARLAKYKQVMADKRRSRGQR